MLIVTYRYVACILNTSHFKSDKYSDDMQDPRIARCLSELLHDTAEKNIQQFGCNGTCEDDWPKVVLRSANIWMHNIEWIVFLQGCAASKRTQQHKTKLWSASMVRRNTNTAAVHMTCQSLHLRMSEVVPNDSQCLVGTPSTVHIQQLRSTCRCLEGRSENWLDNLCKLLQATPHAGLGEVHSHLISPARCKAQLMTHCCN